MDRERLLSLPHEALQDIARRSGMTLDESSDKTVLVEQILEALEEDRSDRERSNNIEMLVKEKKFELNPDDDLEYRDLEERELPESYGETSVALLLRDPSWAFAYWDIAPEHAELVGREEDEPAGLLLRVLESDPGVRNGSKQSFDIPVRGKERRWYVHLPQTGRDYHVELVAVVRGAERVLCRSNVVSSPDTTIDDIDSEHDIGYARILSVSGIQEIEEIALHGGIPQRIISLLDTQYLHLKG